MAQNLYLLSYADLHIAQKAQRRDRPGAGQVLHKGRKDPPLMIHRVTSGMGTNHCAILASRLFFPVENWPQISP